MKYVLTDDEKRKLRERYLENIERVNKNLPNNLKIRPNIKAFNRKLNDPIEQRKYKRSLEIREKQLKREKIASELFAKYEHLKKPDKNYFFERNVSFIIDERPGAEKYNEAMIKTYMLHPEAVSQYFYKKAMDLNPYDVVKICKNSDMDNQLLEFYSRNRVACDFGFIIKDAHTDFEQINEVAKPYLDSVKFSYETMNDTGLLSRKIDEDYFCMPVLNPEQEMEYNSVQLTEEDNAFSNKMSTFKVNQQIIGMVNQDLKKMSENIEKGKYDINKPGAFSYYVTKNKDGKSYGSFVKNIIGQENNDSEIIKLDEETADKIRNFYEKDYIAEENVKFPKPLPNDNNLLDEFRYRYAMNNNKYLYKLEEKKLSTIFSEVRKGFFEYIRRSTSKFTKDLLSQMREYENPESKDYQNKEKLKEAAEAYLKHRNVSTREDAFRQNSSAKNRSLICLDIVAAINALNENANIKLDNEIDKDNDLIITTDSKSKEKSLFVDPDEILNEGKIENRGERKDFLVEIKEDIDKDEYGSEISPDQNSYVEDCSFVIRDEEKIIENK